LSEPKKQNYLRGAAILAVMAVIVKIISAIYKIPLFNLLSDEGAGIFQVTYGIYTLMITITTVGIPVALSRLVSAAAATGRTKLVKRYFSVALPAFAVVGIVVMAGMILFADNLAALMNTSNAAPGIRVLAPAVFFGCVVSIYRGYTQGHSNMIPTAVSQFLEAICKAVFGLAVAWVLIQQGFDTPIVSAGAIVGVTIGLGISIPVLIYFKRKTDRTSLRAVSADRGDIPGGKSLLGQIFKVSIPITLGSAFISIMTNIDTSVVKGQLLHIGLNTADANAMYGIYGKGMTLLVLPSSFIVPIAVSIIPAIAAAIASGRHREAKDVMESSMKLTNLLAMPAAAGISILATPIFTVLYGSNDIGPKLLTIMGIASYFVCMQHMTTAVLQANGYEKVPILTYPIAGIIQIVIDYVLVGNPDIGIIGSPFGTLSCYVVIMVLNMLFIVWKIRDRPNLAKVFLKPALCTGVMGVAAWAIYELLYKVGSNALGTDRLAVTVYLAGAILVALIVYGILIIATRTVTRDDMRLIPKGEKIANFLKIK
jgi:stage V sporulation protein B